MKLRIVWIACLGCSLCEPPNVVEPDPTVDERADLAWTDLSHPAASGSLGASLTATDDAILATWMEPLGEGHRIRFARWDGSWGAAQTVVEGEDLIANWADFPRAERGGGGAVYVHSLHRAGEAAYAYEIRLNRLVGGSATHASRRESLGVVHHDGTPTEHGFVSMLPTDDGIQLFWLDGRATLEDGATQVRTAHVQGGVGRSTVIDERVCDCCQTDAVMTPDGPLVAFRDRSEGEVRDISVARGNGLRFSEPQLVHDDGWEIAGCPVNGPQLASRGDTTAVAWFTGAQGGAVQVAFDRAEGFGAPITVDAHQPPGRVDLAMLDDGAAVSWLARSGEVRVRFVGSDGSLGAPTRVGAAGVDRAAGFPVMVRWREHLYVVHRSGEQLKFARLATSALPRVEGEPEEAPVARVAVGDACPTARVETEEGTVNVAERGPRVVAFYARWCQPCREELRMLEELREDLPVLAVSVDEGSLERATRVARGWGFEGDVGRDEGAAAQLGVPPLPATFVIDDEGRLRFVAAGELADANEIRAALRSGP